MIRLARMGMYRESRVPTKTKLGVQDMGTFGTTWMSIKNKCRCLGIFRKLRNEGKQKKLSLQKAMYQNQSLKECQEDIWTRFHVEIKLYFSTTSWPGSFCPLEWQQDQRWLCLRVLGAFWEFVGGYFWLTHCWGKEPRYWRFVGKDQVIQISCNFFFEKFHKKPSYLGEGHHGQGNVNGRKTLSWSYKITYSAQCLLHISQYSYFKSNEISGKCNRILETPFSRERNTKLTEAHEI